MKKQLLLLSICLVAGLTGFSQVKTNPKKSDSIYIIKLCYDTCKKTIVMLHPSSVGLSATKSYRFQVCNINSALFSLKSTASNITRAAALPPILSSLSGAVVTSKLDNSHSLNFDGSIKQALKPNPYQVFFKNYYDDYNFLRSLSIETKDLVKYASEHFTELTETINSAQQTSNRLEALGGPIVDQLGRSIFVPGTPDTLTNDMKLKGFMPIEKHLTLKMITTRILADFMARGSIINSKPKVSDYLNLEQLTSVKEAYGLIRADSAFLAQCATIIESIMKSKCCLITNPYQITSDYLQLNISLLKTNFSGKPDTVASQKLNFYKTQYWKWIDVSAGLFYNNLAAKSYYFKNSVPTIENRSSADYAIGALVHSYWVWSSCVKTGPVAGVAASVLDGKSRYLLGGSVVIGRNNEFAFSGGMAWAYLPQISNIYKSPTYTSTTTTVATGADGTVTTTSSSVTSPVGTNGAVSTYSKPVRGFFISLTYSFLKL